MKNIIIFIVLMILFIGCNKRFGTEEHQTISKPNIDSIISLEALTYKHDVVLKQQLIILEQTKNSLIGDVSQIELTDSAIYILDSYTKNMLVFDWNGNYLYSIGKKGNGPGEFLSISSFYINPEKGTINLIDPLKMSIHKYTVKGQYISSIKFKNKLIPTIKRITMLDNETLFCVTSLNWLENSGYFLLNENDYSYKCNIYNYPHINSTQTAYFNSKQLFSVHNGNIHFVIPFSDTIYSYSNNLVKSDLLLEHGRKPFPISKLEKYINNNSNNYVLAVIDILQNSNYTTGFTNLFESERYLCVTYEDNKMLSHAILLDKKDSKEYKIEDFYSPTPNFASLSCNYKNHFVRVWKQDEIASFKDCNNESIDIPSEWVKLIEQYNEEDGNPILIIYTLRN